MRTTRRTNPRRFVTTASIAASIALATASCGVIGGDDTTASGDQAEVTVGGVQSGCAAAIDLALVLGGAPQPSITAIDMAAYASDVDAVRNEFNNRPDAVTEYLDLVSDVVSNAAEQAADSDDATPEQIMLLLEFEQAGRRADLDRLTPEADRYFRASCGDSYDNVSDQTSFAADKSQASDGTTDAAQSVGGDESGAASASSTTVAPPPAAPSLDVEDTSVGANGVYLTMEIEVGEIWRTNLTPEAAINGGTELVEDEIVMVELRLTSTGASVFSNASDFGWLEVGGERTNAIGAVNGTGADWDARVDANESKRGFLIFPGLVGPTDGAALQGFGGDTVAENIPLGAGAESSPYPFDLPDGQIGSGILSNGSTSVCEYPTNTEVRAAAATLDGFTRNGQIVRPTRNERFVSFEVAFTVLEVNGEACDWSTTIYGNLTNMRLRLDNGDVVGTLGTIDRLDVGTTTTGRLEFAVPQDTESFELLLDDDSVIATWNGIALPEA